MDFLINNLYSNNLVIAFTFLILFVVCEITFILLALKKEKYKRILPIPFVISFISIILAIPFLFNEVAFFNAFVKQKTKDAIELEKKAIELSFIPVQKGVNYIRLSQLHKANRNGIEAMRALNKARTYFDGHYNHRIYRETYNDWFIYGQFDSVIDCLENSNIYNSALPKSYLLLGKNEKAYKCLMNLDLFGPEEYAMLAYILKLEGNEEKSLEFYNKALEFAHNDKQKTIVDGYYNDSVGYSISEINKKRAYLNLPPLEERISNDK